MKIILCRILNKYTNTFFNINDNVSKSSLVTFLIQHGKTQCLLYSCWSYVWRIDNGTISQFCPRLLRTNYTSFQYTAMWAQVCAVEFGIFTSTTLDAPIAWCNQRWSCDRFSFPKLLEDFLDICIFFLIV